MARAECLQSLLKLQGVLVFFLTIDKAMISIAEKIFAETQICDLKLPKPHGILHFPKPV